MPINIFSWFSATTSTCPTCGRSHSSSAHSAPIPIVHPVPRRMINSLCDSCKQAIPWIVHPLCRVCGRHERCEDCIRRKDRQYSISRCAVRYDSLMKEWLALYKYRGSERLEPILAAMLAYAYERLCEENRLLTTQSVNLSVTSVPLAPERLQDRGFNQAERLALQLSQWYGLSYRSMLLRLHHTEKQSLKTRRNRVVDMRGNFSAVPMTVSSHVLSPGSPTVPTTISSPVLSPVPPIVHSTVLSDIPPVVSSALFSNRRIILIDDIYTTGSTLNECARVLREAADSAAVPEIYGLLWARS
jgi:competence protein ComFC